MPAASPPNEQEVYLAFHSVFKGLDAQVRRQQVIIRIVNQNENVPEVAQFLEQYRSFRSQIYRTLGVLLENRVFESHVHAKARFPTLYQPLPAQNAEREASEAEAVVEHARAIEAALKDDAVHDTSEGDSGKNANFRIDRGGSELVIKGIMEDQC